MGSKANKLRKKWQVYGVRSASIAEQNFKTVFGNLFKGTELELVSQPTKFSKIYLGVKLSREEVRSIYNPPEPMSVHGIKPDFLIRNTLTQKEIYVEIKRQDGWVEGGKKSDGRGNAHERLCKYFTPGLLKILTKNSKIRKPNLPFWIVFQGDITRDPRRVREIRCWFDDNDSAVFFWRNSRDAKEIVEHFMNKILPLLE